MNPCICSIRTACYSISFSCFYLLSQTTFVKSLYDWFRNHWHKSMKSLKSGQDKRTSWFQQLTNLILHWSWRIYNVLIWAADSLWRKIQFRAVVFRVNWAIVFWNWLIFISGYFNLFVICIIHNHLSAWYNDILFTDIYLTFIYDWPNATYFQFLIKKYEETRRIIICLLTSNNLLKYWIYALINSNTELYN